MAEDGFSIDYSEFDRALARALAQSKREPAVFMKEQARGIVRKLISITPPASVTRKTGAAGDEDGRQAWNVVLGSDAKKAGEIAIKTDVLGGRRGLAGTGNARRAGIFTILNESIIASQAKQEANQVRLWVTKDGRVYGTQNKYFVPNAAVAEMMTHHDAYFKNGRMSSAGAYSRDIGRWKWIDQMVVGKAAFNRFYNVLKKRVGWLAAGWNQAAAELGIKPPEWIWRHNAPGSGKLTVTSEGVHVKLTNKVDYASSISHFARRVQWAVDSQAAAMNRRSEKFLQKLLKDEGFKLT